MRAFAIAISVVFTASLAGQTVRITALPKPVLGAGATLCSQWMANVEPGFSGGQQDPVNVSWILGYVSASAVTGRLTGRDAESYILGFVTSTCENNPAQSLGAATESLVAFLQTHDVNGNQVVIAPVAPPIKAMPGGTDYR